MLSRLSAESQGSKCSSRGSRLGLEREIVLQLSSEWPLSPSKLMGLTYWLIWFPVGEEQGLHRGLEMSPFLLLHVPFWGEVKKRIGIDRPGSVLRSLRSTWLPWESPGNKHSLEKEKLSLQLGTASQTAMKAAIGQTKL